MNESPASRAFARQACWARIALLVILVASAALRLRDLGGPWGWGIRDHEGALFQIFVRNALRTKDAGMLIAPAVAVTPDPELSDRYTNHPPLHYLLLAAFVLALGEHEWVFRLEPCLASIATVLITFAIARKMFGIRHAVLSAFLIGLLPQAVFLATDVNFQTLNLALMLLTVLCYLRWWERPTAERLVLLLGAFLIAVLSDWPALFLAVALPLHVWLTHGRGSPARRLAWSLPVAGALVIVTFVLLTARFPRSEGTGSTVLSHVASSILTLGGLSFRDWLDSVWTWMETFQGTTLIVMACAGAALAARHSRPSFFLLLVLLGVGIANLLAFPCHASIHYQWNAYLIPFLVLGAAHLLTAMLSWVEGRRRSLVPLVALAVLTSLAWLFSNQLHVLRRFDSPAPAAVELGRQIRAEAPIKSIVLVPCDADVIVNCYAERNVVGRVRDVFAFAGSDEPPVRMIRKMVERGFPIWYAIPSGMEGLVPEAARVAALPSTAASRRFRLHDVTCLFRLRLEHRGRGRDGNGELRRAGGG